MEDMNVQNMVWRPTLVKLTQIGSPEWNNGETTTCYVEPSSITHIQRGGGAVGTKANEMDKKECTFVCMCHGTLLVTETPEEVARLRDAAFGYNPPKPKPFIASHGATVV